MSKPRFTPSMQWVSNAAGQMGSEAQRILRALIDIAWNRTGKETSAVVTGTAGTAGNISKWDANGDLVDGGKAAADLLTSPEFLDTVFRVKDNADPTKELAFQVSGIATATTRTLTAQDKSGTVGLLEGTTTNDNAAAGQIGEEIYSDVLVADAVSLASTVAANVTSISLTAGDWDLTGFVSFQPAATTSITAMFASMNTTSATLSGDNGFAYAWTQNATVPNAIIRLNAMGPVRVSLASTTTYYLVARATFTVDALTAFGLIRARRMR